MRFVHLLDQHLNTAVAVFVAHLCQHHKTEMTLHKRGNGAVARPCYPVALKYAFNSFLSTPSVRINRLQ